MTLTFAIWKEIADEDATIWECYDAEGQIRYTAIASDKLPTRATSKTPMHAWKVYRQNPTA